MKQDQASFACVVDYCNNKNIIPPCLKKRDPDATVDVFEAPPLEDGRLFYGPMDDRYAYIRTFQKVDQNHQNIELHDIVIYLSLNSYHRLDRNDTLELQTNSTQTTTITSVISNKLKLKFYLLEICDKEIAKQIDPPSGDIFLNRDLHDVQFREYFTSRMEFEYDINCGGCQYEPHNFVFCLDLKKQKVCQLDNDDKSEAKVFNQGNYVFVIVIDYFNWMYQFKLKRGEPNASKFGEEFNVATGDCGIPLFINHLKLETTWKPDFSSSNPMSSLFDLMNRCCNKNTKPEGEEETENEDEGEEIEIE